MHMYCYFLYSPPQQVLDFPEVKREVLISVLKESYWGTRTLTVMFRTYRITGNHHIRGQKASRILLFWSTEIYETKVFKRSFSCYKQSEFRFSALYINLLCERKNRRKTSHVQADPKVTFQTLTCVLCLAFHHFISNTCLPGFKNCQNCNLAVV